MDRRQFLTRAGALGLTSLPILGIAQENEWVGPGFWDRPRYIDLQRKDTTERFGVVYFRDGQVDAQGYQKACEVLRDAHEGVVYNMDIRLLDLICATQSWVRHFGYNVPFLVHSGYRSPRTNAQIEGAARNSKHMSGQALDFTVPGLPAEYMGRLAQRFLSSDGQGGGVGFYTTAQFTHMDTSRGAERAWRKG
jgi:uncharacterized protein YcbK (DUF882 family)